MAPVPSPTKTWHNDTYPSISPSNPSISSSIANKNIIITGGGHGIGSTTAHAFAEAGASYIHLLGRQESKLHETRDSIISSFPTCQVLTHICDITSAEDVSRAASATGTWDILVLNAGYMEAPSSLLSSSSEEWWRVFTVNVLGLHNLVKSFLPLHRRKPKPTSNGQHSTSNSNGNGIENGSGSDAIVINTTAGLCHMPPSFCATFSAYASSKMAAAKLVEVLADENRDVHWVNMHPGVIDTSMAKKGGLVASGKVPVDDPRLPAHFTLWLASPEAAFLRGRFVWCNWDVPELIAMKDKIAKSTLFTTNLEGFPFENMS
ncbi:MAG: hypothetical protein Q9227_001368 [Pyrenula ochraceoflavens]